MALAEHRFTIDSDLSPEALLDRLDDMVRTRKGRVDVRGPLIRMPMVAHLAAGHQGVRSTVDVHLETAEGRYLYYVPAFFRQAKSAFGDVEEQMRRVASA